MGLEYLLTSSLIIMSCVAVQASVQPIRIDFSSGVSQEIQSEITQDIDLLRVSQFSDFRGEAQKVLKLQKLDGISLENWLADRMHFIINENHPVDNSTMHLKANGPIGVVMSNIGAAIYPSVKKYNRAVILDIEGVGPVEVRSPRVGIFKVGPFFLNPIFSNDRPQDLKDFVHRSSRLATLFHESRHSDGNGENVSFPHALCPKGHLYEDLYACDTPTNGPYKVGALILSAIEQGCTACTSGDHDALKILRNDSLSRVLPSTTPVEWNDTPEELK